MSVQGWVSASVAAADNPDRAVFVAEIDGRPVGMIALGERTHFTGQVDAYISEFVVAEDAEGRGAGRALMLAAEQWATRRGRSHLTLETGAANHRARGFYRHLGYLEEDVRLPNASGDARPPVASTMSWSPAPPGGGGALYRLVDRAKRRHLFTVIPGATRRSDRDRYR